MKRIDVAADMRASWTSASSLSLPPTMPPKNKSKEVLWQETTKKNNAFLSAVLVLMIKTHGRAPYGLPPPEVLDQARDKFSGKRDSVFGESTALKARRGRKESEG